jgi:hypothetical protein
VSPVKAQGLSPESVWRQFSCCAVGLIGLYYML